LGDVECRGIALSVGAAELAASGVCHEQGAEGEAAFDASFRGVGGASSAPRVFMRVMNSSASVRSRMAASLACAKRGNLPRGRPSAPAVVGRPERNRRALRVTLIVSLLLGLPGLEPATDDPL
jgi:hypothetical protein